MAAAAHLEIYKDTLIVLTTAGVVVPIMQRLRLSPILGYLAAGALLGPKGLGAVSDSFPALGWITISEKDITGLAELGVVFLLFVIGLELSLPRLWTMRRMVFGLGTLQVLTATLVIALIAPLFGNGAEAAALIGVSLALSSTAIVIELLSRRRKLNSAMGRTCFAILLLQDLAVVPMLLLVDLLSMKDADSLLVSVVRALTQAGGMVVLIVAVGSLLLRPFFRLVAQRDSSELFMAATLLVVIGTSVLAASAGLSMSLGAFLAGLLLAETEYRKAIEATIEPFKGLLLGVFFISVGMKIDLPLLVRNLPYLMSCAAGLVLIKAALVTPLSRLFGLSWAQAVEVGLLLGPGGEFAFIIIGLAMAAGLVDASAGTLVLTVVVMTMAALPLLASLGEMLGSRLDGGAPPDPVTLIGPSADGEARALVIGCGRVGQLVSDMLTTHDVPHLIVESDTVTVGRERARGRNVFFGDGKIPQFLRQCGVDRAAAAIITINAPAEIDEIVTVVRGLRPDIVIVSRARDARHARHLYSLGVTDAVPETVEASLQLSEAVLVGLGVPTGPVIASIHEKRDEFRRELQQASGEPSRPVRGIRAKGRHQPAETSDS